MSRDRGLIVGAVGISALGDFLLWIPLTLHILELTGSGVAVAALMICLWGPIVLLAPAAGMLADRFETRRLLIWASLAQAAVAAALALALDSPAAILALAALLGAGFAVAQPAEFALVPVIGRDNLNGAVEAARYVGMTAGPLLGAALAAAGGTAVALLVDAATFACVALAAGLLRARRQPGPQAIGERARDGVVLLFRDRTLAVVLATVLASLLFMSASIAAEIVFLRDDLELTGAAYGVLFSSWTVGMVFGALVVSPRVRVGTLAGAALVAVGVQGAGLGLPTVWLAAGFGRRDVVHRRRRPRRQERARAGADPGARPGPLSRARLRRLQRPAQRRRAGGAGVGRRARGRGRCARDARARGRDRGSRRALRRARLPGQHPEGARAPA